MVENKKEKKKCWTCFCCCCFKTKRKDEEEDEVTGRRKDEYRERAYEFNEDAIPYVGDLSNLKVGQLICVVGYVNFRCRRFSINLLCSQDPNGDIAFHFNPRMEQRYIVRNCRVKGYWGDEETCTNASFDFAVGKRFKVDFLVAEREFMVSVNGKHWCAFTYRVPVQRIVGMEIRGKVDVAEVAIKDVDAYPVIPEPAITIGVNDDKMRMKCIPFLGKLSKPLALGWALEICGRLMMLPQSFYINLQDGIQMWPHPVIPLHLNPRFSTSAGVDVFVRNAWLDGDWGPEERAPIFPFLSGAEFKILIRREADCFTIWVGEKVVAIFKFRGGVDSINYVYIAGDLTVMNVTLRDKNSELDLRLNDETVRAFNSKR